MTETMPDFSWGPVRGRKRPLLIVASAMALAAAFFPAAAAGSGDTIQFSVIPGPLGYGQTPGVSDVPRLDLRGSAEQATVRMANFAVRDATGTGQGWSITVSGDGSAGRSAVLAQYCPRSICGSDRGPGYVAGGRWLPPNSLTYDSSGARFVRQGGTTGAKPAHQCDSGCFVDAPPDSPSRIAVAADGAGMGTFQTSGASEVSLVAPNTARPLPAKEVYRVNLSWTLNSGP